MRLALVERYLNAADSETTADAKKAQLERARFHAGEAAARATTSPDRARALRYLGWTTALLTDPATGAALLEQSLVKEPGNPDALWFLATVRFDKLDDPVAAKPLLEQLLATPIDDAQRQAVQAKLDKVNAALSSPAPTSSNRRGAGVLRGGAPHVIAGSTRLSGLVRSRCETAPPQRGDRRSPPLTRSERFPFRTRSALFFAQV